MSNPIRELAKSLSQGIPRDDVKAFIKLGETFKIEMDAKLATGEITLEQYQEVFETPEMKRQRRALFTKALRNQIH
jgi:hypothetical protein